jgi:2-(1,2-epoxy-1,2-dihydrophenyl)acetyl-CoA isomerase
MTDSVRTQRRGAVLEIRINRPDRLNAFDVPTFAAFRKELQAASLERSVRAVILTGEGRAFSAGGDVAAMDRDRANGTLPLLFHDLTAGQELAVREIVGMRKPVLASLPGVAAGGGMSLALAADWRIGSEHALLVPAFPGLGAVPDGGLTYFLPHFLGIGLAQEVLFSNAKISAARARELGLLQEIVPAAELDDRAWARAEEFAAGPTFAYGWMKRLMTAAFSESLESQMMLERRGAVEAAEGSELPEGIRAFLEKRPPRFARD